MNLAKLSIDKKQLPWLDAFRFIAAFMVLLSHTRTDYFTEYGMLPESQQNVATMLFYFIGRLGHEAVIAFFVLSGFLVGGKLIERVRNNSFDVKTYAIDRTVRIGIPLLAAIIYCWFVSLIASDCSLDFLTALGNLFSLQGLLCDPLVPPFWSLSYEVWFYLIGASIALFFSADKWGGVKIVCY